MRSGLFNAIFAYMIWGLLPLCWKHFETMPAGEILSHRMIWSFVFSDVTLISFILIWAALIVYAAASIRDAGAHSHSAPLKARGGTSI